MPVRCFTLNHMCLLECPKSVPFNWQFPKLRCAQKTALLYPHNCNAVIPGLTKAD